MSFTVHDDKGKQLSFDELVHALLVSLDKSFKYFFPDKELSIPSRLTAAFIASDEPLGGLSIEEGENSILLQGTNGRMFQIKDVEMMIFIGAIARLAVAKKIYCAGKREEAWTELSAAAYDAGRLALLVDVNVELEKDGYAPQRQTRSMLARMGAESRHSKHRAMKSEVFKWLDTNMVKYKSLDGAAEAIAGKVVPIAFRTARDWVGEWKKLRSAGTT